MSKAVNGQLDQLAQFNSCNEVVNSGYPGTQQAKHVCETFLAYKLNETLDRLSAKKLTCEQRLTRRVHFVVEQSCFFQVEPCKKFIPV